MNVGGFGDGGEMEKNNGILESLYQKNGDNNGKFEKSADGCGIINNNNNNNNSQNNIIKKYI